MVEKVFLIVSDSHKAYENLEEIVAREGSKIDYVIHSGDFANIMDPEKHIKEVQEDGLAVYQTSIDILKKAGKPIFCVPGNHDSDRLFPHLTQDVYSIDGVYLLGAGLIEVDGLRFVGLGGAPPGRCAGGIAFPGNPFETLQAYEEAITEHFDKYLNSPNTIVITHAPPLDLGVIDTKIGPVDSGSIRLQEIIESHSSNIIFISNGHKHEQLYVPSFKGTVSVNAGSSTVGDYMILKIELNETWKVKEVLLKNLQR